MNTHYYNAYHTENGFNVESDSLTYKEALEDIDGRTYGYAYTVKVESDGVVRMDLEQKAIDYAYALADEHKLLVTQGLA